MTESYFPVDKILPALVVQGFSIMHVCECRNELAIMIKTPVKTRDELMAMMDQLYLVMLILGVDNETMEFDYSARDGQVFYVADTRYYYRTGASYVEEL